MSKLTDEQIDYITDQVNSSLIESVELREDLIDHFCCIIEFTLKEGQDFEEAYQKAYNIVCPNGFDEIHQESILLLTTKKIILMKKLLFILGFVTTVFITTSYMFKALHLQGAGVLLGISIILLILVFVPLLLLYFYRKEFSKFISYKLKYVFGFIGIALLLTALLFKIMQWPGFGLLILISMGFINFGFLPFFFYRLYKQTSESSQKELSHIKTEYILGFIGIALFLTATVFKILHYPLWPLLTVISIAILNLGFLPFLFYNLYRKSTA